MIAFTRAVPSTLDRCELPHVAREPIDVTVAQAQHAEYEAALRASGVDVTTLPTLNDLPDSVFVEDTAIILDEIAVLTRPGAEARRAEVESVRDALLGHRSIATIEARGTLDGGGGR